MIIEDQVKLDSGACSRYRPLEEVGVLRMLAIG